MMQKTHIMTDVITIDFLLKEELADAIQSGNNTETYLGVDANAPKHNIPPYPTKT